MPCIIFGRANGNWTPHNFCFLLAPKDSAASITSLSTNLIPKSVKRINGGQAYINIPIMAGIAPRPNKMIPGIK